MPLQPKHGTSGPLQPALTGKYLITSGPVRYPIEAEPSLLTMITALSSFESLSSFLCRGARSETNTTLHQRNARQNRLFFFFASPASPIFFQNLVGARTYFRHRTISGWDFFGEREKKSNGPTGPMGSDSLLPFTACAGALTTPATNQSQHIHYRDRKPLPVFRTSLFSSSWAHTLTHPARTGSCRRCSSTLQQHTQRHRHRHKCAWHFALLATFLLSSYLMSGQHPSPFLASAAYGLLKARISLRHIFLFYYFNTLQFCGIIKRALHFQGTQKSWMGFFFFGTQHSYSRHFRSFIFFFFDGDFFLDTHHFLFGFYYCESMIPTFGLLKHPHHLLANFFDTLLEDRLLLLFYDSSLG